MDWRRQRGEEEEVPEQLMYCEEGLTMDVLSARVHVCVCVCVCVCVRVYRLEECRGSLGGNVFAEAPSL